MDRLYYLLFLFVPVLAQAQLVSSNLPIVVINTQGVDIPDEPKITADMGIIYNGPGMTNHLSDPFNHYNGKIGIERRGSTSQMYPKRPYGIETRTATGENLNVSLLGMPAENDWALIAPFNDKTLMRDVIAHAYAADVLPWSPRTRHCEVILNGNYIGVYILIETIKRDDNRVDISKLRPEDQSGDELTGGYLLRIDKTPFGPGGDWVSDYAPPLAEGQEIWFQFRDPKTDELQPVQAAYIENHMHAFEDMLQAPDYAEHYADWIDVDAWIDYLLVTEMAKNVDGYRISTYFYKEKDSKGGKIVMGPVWDFNIAFGIGNYCHGQYWQGWAKDFNEVCGGDAWLVPFWWERLWNEPKFRNRIATRWAEHRSHIWSDDKLLGRIDSIQNYLAEAQFRNFQRWPIFGEYIWPNSFVGNNYAEEINYLKSWLKLRLCWLDENIAMLVPTEEPEMELALSIYPNPSQGQFSIDLPLNQQETWTVLLYDTAGNQVWQTVRQNTSGTITVNVPPYLPPGIYFCKVVYENCIRLTTKVQLLPRS